MRDLINEAVDSKPDGLVVSIPDPAIGPRCGAPSAPASRSCR
jgi:hypothetical protein